MLLDDFDDFANLTVCKCFKLRKIKSRAGHSCRKFELDRGPSCMARVKQTATKSKVVPGQVVLLFIRFSSFSPFS